jgi:hypothetical protein
MALLHFPTLHNRYILVWFISGGSSVFNHANDVDSINDLAEHDMFVVQERRCGSCDEELAAIGVWARVLIER